MDFVNRTPQARPAADGSLKEGVAESGRQASKKSNTPDGSMWFRIAVTVMAVLLMVIIAALAVKFDQGNGADETKLVNKNEYQAVFVNVNGTQGTLEYIGHIQTINNQFVNLTNVFYVQQQEAGSATTPVKLGCEAAGSEDQVVIKTAQVSFWENLKSTGKVAKAVAQFYSQNPNGPNCADYSAGNNPSQLSGPTIFYSAPTPLGTSTTSNAAKTTTKQ